MIFVDTPKRYDTNLRYKVWSHMSSDESDDELHYMAEQLNLPRKWFQPARKSATPLWQRYYAHYDITPSKYNKALTLGAQIMEPTEFMKHLERTVVFAPFSEAVTYEEYDYDPRDAEFWNYWPDPNE